MIPPAKYPVIHQAALAACDALDGLEQWVEQGTAPDQVVASHVAAGTVDRTRPLCPYPQIAKYTGTGGINEATNFVSVVR